MTELASASQLREAYLRWALVCVPVVLTLGFLSGMAAGSGPDNPWFASLAKPSIYPPPATFGIVWSVLYVLMGLALAIVVSARGAVGRGAALGAFAVQLALNLAWSPLFFAMHHISLALGLLGLLVIALIATIVLFRKVPALAAWLLLPYLAWILFAGVLNWQFLVLNPDADGQEISGAVTRIEL
mgnify:CR=1 FL=1